MSIVIITFDGAPKVSEDAQKKEADLDARLETKIKGKHEKNVHVCFIF